MHYNNQKPYQLPENAIVAVYEKQSTCQHRVHDSSTAARQTDLLRDCALRMGIAQENIIGITDSPTSGEHRRSGLQALIDHIIKGDIQAVYITLENALFADEHQISVTAFIRLCHERRVLVYTPRTIYDLSDPYDAHQFRLQAGQDTYIQEYVRSRLHHAKAQAAMQGCYDGRKLPPGYIVDRRLRSAREANATYKRLIPYEPHAVVILNIFHQYVEFGGRMNEFYTFLQSVPVLFPELDESVDQWDRSQTPLKKVTDGYHITLAVLKHMVGGNEVYIGT